MKKIYEKSTREGKYKRLIHETCDAKDNPKGVLRTLYYIKGIPPIQTRITNYKICDVCDILVKISQENIQ